MTARRDLGSGMVTGVGLTAGQLRRHPRALDNFPETRFMTMAANGSSAARCRSRSPGADCRLVHCSPSRFGNAFPEPVAPGSIPVLLCVAEEERPGRLEGFDNALFSSLRPLGMQFHPASRLSPARPVGPRA